MRPETKYAKSGDVHIAYQVVGDGPIDLVAIPGWISHVEDVWELPTSAHLYHRLASFARLILFDKRGTGLSDRVSETVFPTLEQRMDDVRAVMDAVGSERAALFGTSEGGPMSILFAATYPQRTSALIMYGCYAYWLRAPDYPWAPTREQHQKGWELMEQGWGTTPYAESNLKVLTPSAAHDEQLGQLWARFQRRALSPGAAVTLARMNADIDVRHILPAVHVPTLIIHHTGDRLIRIGNARYMAERIPNAKFAELPGEDHMMVRIGDVDEVANEVEEFLTGTHSTPEPDRVLATVLFTDIVNSTQRAAELGDRRWHDLIDNHNTILQRELARFRGRAVHSTGDGVLATFDGPARAIRCACAIGEAVKPLGVEIRAGLHTGEIELLSEDVAGIAVHIGARVAAMAGPSEVLVSSTVKDLVAGSGLRFAERGTHALKGVPGEWRLFAVER